MNEENDVHTLHAKITEIISKKQDNTDNTIQWIDDLFQQDEQIIQRLISSVNENDKPELKKLFKVIHFLYQKRESIITTLTSMPELITKLAWYITNEDSSSIEVHPFHLLVLTYSIDLYGNYFSSESFVKNIFVILNNIFDSDVFEQLVLILIDVNSIFPSIEGNTFVTVYRTIEHSRVVSDMILKIVNFENDKERLLKELLVFLNLMESEKKIIFYSKDLECFIDMLLLKLQTFYTEEVKFFLLKTLENITKYKEYFKRMYKSKEITDLLEDYKNNDDNGESIKELSGKILGNIQKGIVMRLKAETKGISIDEYEEEEEEEEEEEDDDEEGEEEEK